ncbi:MAG TPA: hypothetical protein PLX30_09005 [Methanothrix sp.]|nr:hypothetical protein [Methanothrix sp.]
MFNSFLNKMAGDIAQRWSNSSIMPALAFWIGGLITLIHSQGWKWDVIIKFTSGVDIAQGLIFAFSGLILVTVSSSLMRWFQLPLLQFAEGYWPSKFNNIKLFFIHHQKQILSEKEQIWNELAKRYDTLEGVELDKYATIDSDLDNYPSNQKLLLPTRVGNILRAAEEYPFLRYGLNIFVVWPRLWLILPENVKQELNFARATLNDRVLLMTWSFAFSIWAIWNLWALIFSFLGVVIAYIGLVHAAYAYSDLMRATFDLHRNDLFKALDFPLPECGKEYQSGKMLTHYLKRNLNYTDGLQDTNILYHR